MPNVDPLMALAEQIDKVLAAERITFGPNALAILHDGGTVRLSGGERWSMALAAAAVALEFWGEAPAGLATGRPAAAPRVVVTEPVGEIAVHPDAAAALVQAMAEESPPHALWAAGITRHSPLSDHSLAPGRYADLPVVRDASVPAGEVHLRPAGGRP